MISWNIFSWFAVPAMMCWICGAFLAWKEKKAMAISTTIMGTVIFSFFIVSLWINLERPPLRTMGETRLWYTFFMPVVGTITYFRWRSRWIYSFSTLMSVVFVAINLIKPEIHNKILMPALQSVWFAPHVIVYMFAYAIMGVATMMTIPLLFPIINNKFNKLLNCNTTSQGQWMAAIDNLVNTGIVFITMGMLFGALWAKEAWGHYWTWDPKETWAATTWMLYLIYLHMRISKNDKRTTLWLLVLGFVCLQMCWWGINYLPLAQGASIHTYNLD